MFTLVTDRSRYYRIKRGQTADEIERVLNTPVIGGIFDGRIIEAGDKKLIRYVAKVGDTYRTVAEKFCTDEEALKSINGNKPVYPTCKLFVPQK